MWVDLPDEALKLPDGEPGPEGVPETGESMVRWGPVVTRKMPEVLMLQQRRLDRLTKQVRVLSLKRTGGAVIVQPITPPLHHTPPSAPQAQVAAQAG